MVGPFEDPQFQARIIAAEIAALTGESTEIVILHALQESLRRLTAPTSSSERARRILTILETSLWQNTSESRLGQSITREREDEILGYGPEGV